MPGIVIELPYIHIIDANGDPVPGAEIYVYDSGTTLERNVFSDVNLTVPLTQPILTDGGGKAGPIYMDPDLGDYKLRIVYDTIDESYDNLKPGVSVPVSVAQGGTGATDAPTARANLGAASQAQVDQIDTDLGALDTKVGTPPVWPATDLPFATTLTPDYSNSQNVQVATITANTYVNTPTGIPGAPGGMAGRLILINDGVGGKEITFDPAWNFPDLSPALSLEPNAVNVVGFFVMLDGSIISEVTRYGTSERLSGPDVLAHEHKASGVSGGSTSGNGSTWTDRDLTRLLINRGSIASLSSGNLVLDAGRYYAEGVHSYNNAASYAQTRLRNKDNGATLGSSDIWGGGSFNQGNTIFSCEFTLSSQSTLACQYYVNAGSANGLGAGFDTGEDGIFGVLKVWAL